MKKSHGDVVIIPTTIQNTAKPVQRDWVMEGEVTGHFHRIRPKDPGASFQVFEDPTLEEGKQVLLRVLGGNVEVYHPEHEAFTIPPGDYATYPVREVDHIRQIVQFVAD